MPAGSNARRAIAAVLLGGALLLCQGLTAAQNPNEKEIKPAPNIQDKDEIYDKNGEPKLGSKLWVLDFRIKPLRSIKVNVPGRGEQICYYLWYQVTNKTAEPHTFVPDFELVTQDTRMAYRDEILPSVQEAIIAREDPTGVLGIKNSVTITKDPIPPSRPMALPRPVTGVAIWTDPNEPLTNDSTETRKKKEKLPKFTDSHFFSIFAAGLSNGWAEAETVGGETVVRRKTLQLKFQRIGDGALRRDEDIKYITPEWLYRASTLLVPKDEEAPKPKPEPKPEPKP
jgi:hypothetical protein